VFAATGTPNWLVISRLSIQNAFVVVVGGLPWEIALWGRGFNEGSFSFSHPTLGIAATDEHEAGHGLNLALLGGWFGNIGALDEQFRRIDDELTGVAGTAAATTVFAYSERLAEDNVTSPRPPGTLARPTVSIWR
jgi:hypothetical protein